ncbi:MAG: hypothetical protein ACR2M0_09335 [Chloroflexia bacterium]
MKASLLGCGRHGPPYRVRQFVRALAPVAPAEVEAALRASSLPDDAARLFRAMPQPYQRHALNVAARLSQEGHTEPLLLSAALLHDIGKWDPASGRSVGLLHRVAATLLRRVGPGRALLERLGSGNPSPRSPRYPWRLQQRHPALGAGLAQRAGVDPDVVALVLHHEDADGLPPHLRGALALLQRADDQE